VEDRNQQRIESVRPQRLPALLQRDLRLWQLNLVGSLFSSVYHGLAVQGGWLVGSLFSSVYHGLAVQGGWLCHVLPVYERRAMELPASPEVSCYLFLQIRDGFVRRRSTGLWKDLLHFDDPVSFEFHEGKCGEGAMPWQW
jgi:hypothetical protein